MLLPLLFLAGCNGGGTFITDTFTWWGVNPNAPIGNSETLRKVMDRPVALEPLSAEPGNIWPPPNQPIPSLYDIEKARGINPANPPPQQQRSLPAHRQPTPGSSTPPGTVAPTLPPNVTLPTVPPAPGPAPSPAAPPAGTMVPTPQGPATVTGPTGRGTSGVTLPGGQQGIMIDNGNGTSTLIRPDGTVTTVPTPR
jgi:hypothetical protein